MPITGILDKAGNVHGLDDLSQYNDMPHDLALSLVHEREPRAVPSASALGSCLRRFELERVTDYAVNPLKRMAAFYGNGVHGYLEKMMARVAPGVRTETPLAATIYLGMDLAPQYEEVTITGIMDYWDRDGGAIRDWKTKVYIPVKDGVAQIAPTPAHIFQVNTYHWMLSQHPDYAPVNRMEIVYLDNKTVAGFAMDPWPLAKTEAKVRGVLRTWAAHRLAGTLPPVLDGFTMKGKPTAAPCSYCDLLAVCRGHQADALSIS